MKLERESKLKLANHIKFIQKDNNGNYVTEYEKESSELKQKYS